jgi:type IV pilus assembly protein PilA
MRTKQKGFSLIELLIVVAIILIIAAIAIPNLLRSRMAAAQASAVGSVRTINTAAISYNSTYGNGFPPSIAAIGNNGSTSVTCTNAELIDTVLTSGTKQGYTFILSKGASQVSSAASSCSAGYGYADGYMVTATPVTVGTTGQTSYCSDPSGVIRFNPAGTTNAGPSPNCATTDAPLQ